MKDLGITSVEKIMEYSIKDAGDINVVVGPSCYMPSDGKQAKRWYFCISTCDRTKRFRSDSVTVDSSWGEGLEGCEKARGSLIMALTARRPRVIHTAEDEVTAARLCEALWPGRHISKLRRAIEAEYRGRGWVID
jgi:hypothetical protein